MEMFGEDTRQMASQLESVECLPETLRQSDWTFYSSFLLRFICPTVRTILSLLYLSKNWEMAENKPL